ncbi:glycosyltransferase family 4 protein [Candidatus Saccharibacteria bacterium]|nr:glycosyltransferase family 4 protein [Candidatus Saccharibacteria bacterium]
MADREQLSIAFLADDTLDNDAGVAQYVKRLGGWLSRDGHRVNYLVGRSRLESWRGDPVYSLAHNLTVRWNGNRLSVPLWANRRAIQRLLNERHYDIVHVQAPYSPLLTQLIINRLPDDTALIATFHVSSSSPLTITGGRLLRQVYGRSLKRFNNLISVSQPAAIFARQAFGVASQQLPNTIELDAFKSPPITRRAPKRLVFLGRLVKRKGCAELLMAVASLAKHTSAPAFELIIAGDGPQRTRLERLSRKLGLSSAQVKFLGYVSEKDKVKLLASADIACFPALYGESFGIVLLEAMAAGAKVVIAGDNPGYRSVLAKSPQLLVDPAETKLFADKLLHYLTNKPATDNVQQWLRAEVKQYDIEKVGPKLLKLYRRSIAKQLGRR